MNKELKELVMQAGFSDMAINHHGSRKIIECFAELVRTDEREACAELCEEASLYFESDRTSAAFAADYCAKEIRKRIEK